jgi:hypothetical protein
VRISSRHLRRASVLIGIVVVGLGGYLAYATATRQVTGPIYSRTATKLCLEQRGFVATPSPADEPDHRDLYVLRSPKRPDEYPNLLFFDKRSQAADYAQGDSAPLLRRGNVVIGIEIGFSVSGTESLPTVRPLLACLRSAPAPATQ